MFNQTRVGSLGRDLLLRRDLDHKDAKASFGAVVSIPWCCRHGSGNSEQEHDAFQLGQHTGTEQRRTSDSRAQKSYHSRSSRHPSHNMLGPQHHASAQSAHWYNSGRTIAGNSSPSAGMQQCPQGPCGRTSGMGSMGGNNISALSHEPRSFKRHVTRHDQSKR
jgi:hypothetical protein